jgi:hypothetical protein
VVERRYDDAGIELSHDERREDLLDRLGDANDRGKWVAAADLVHDGGTLLAELARTEFPDTVWGQHAAGGRDATTRWYRRIYDRLTEVRFTAPIMEELGQMVDALEQRAALDGRRRATR